MTGNFIGRRLEALRKKQRLTQDQLARRIGFKDRQTISAMETGARRIGVDELVRAAEVLNARLEDFTDPFRLVGEGEFSWRQSDVAADRLEACQQMAGGWIAAYRALAPRSGQPLPLTRPSLRLTRQSSYEDARAAGERFAAEHNLGECPALRLIGALERDLGILVLMFDAGEEISGAACRLPELDTILISRHEVEGRRHFDLAHELFHVLTWDAIPPKRSETPRPTKGDRAEQLANSFASALLMPTATLERHGEWFFPAQQALVARLNSTANELRVTSSALRWRLVALGKLNRATAKSLPEDALRNNGGTTAPGKTPPPFSKPFVQALAHAVRTGHVSVRRMASLLNMTADSLPDLFAAHGLPDPTRL